MGYRVKSLHLPRKSTFSASAKHRPSSILHANMKVKAKKELGQHFLTDESIARRIVDAAIETLPAASAAPTPASAIHHSTPISAAPSSPAVSAAPSSPAISAAPSSPAVSAAPTLASAIHHSTPISAAPSSPAVSASAAPALLEIGPGTGVLTKYLLAERDRRPDFDLKLIEIDPEAAAFLRQTYPSCRKILYEEDFLQADLSKMFAGDFCVVGNFPYNISSQIFFKLLDCRDRVPAIVGMLQKEVAERLASKPGKKAYGVLSVLLQAWYDIEYLFEVGNHCFNPQPKVQSAVIRLHRNSRMELPCDEMLFKKIVKTGFNQRRKTLRNSLRPLLEALASGADVTRFNAGDGYRSGYGTSTRTALASRSATASQSTLDSQAAIASQSTLDSQAAIASQSTLDSQAAIASQSTLDSQSVLDTQLSDSISTMPPFASDNATHTPQHPTSDTIPNSPQQSELGTSQSTSKRVALNEVLASKTMDLRPEQLSVEDYIALTNFITRLQA